MTLDTINIAEFTALSSKITMEYLEKMTAAYLLLTNLSPDEVELVQETRDWNKIVWYLQKKKHIDENPILRTWECLKD